MPCIRRLALILALLCAARSSLSAQAGNAPRATLDSIAGAGPAQNRVAGLVAIVVKGNDTLLSKAYGKADLEWDIPMTTDAMFEIGSIAKQFVAVAVLQLRDEGKLNLDDPISKSVPELGAAGNTVTLRRLLTHTSGIFRFTEEPEWETRLFVPGMPRDSAWRLIRLEPAQYPAGEAQAYSNSGFWLLGIAVERASGMKYEDYLDTRIFKPLGMTRSKFCNSLEHVTRRAHGYGMPPGQVRRAPMVNYTWAFAPGAVCATAGDLVTWLKALHGGKVLSAKSYAEMTTPAKISDGTEVQYGMGIKVGTDSRGLKYIGHGGTAPGFRADATWYPNAGLAVVVLTNTSPAQLSPGAVGTALARAVLPWPEPDLKYYTGDPAPFVGKYQPVTTGNQQLGIIEVTAGPDGLQFSPGGAPPRRLPWAGGLKFYATDNTTLTFRRAGGDSSPVTELHRDDPGNHTVLRKLP